jgi:hypothetical protein
MEFWKSFFELISSIFFLSAAIIGASAFKYKYDANIRDLHIENCKKIREVLNYFTSNDKNNYELFEQAREASYEAELYLHSDIIAFTKKVLDLVNRFEMYTSSLNVLKDEEKIAKTSNKKEDVKEQLLSLKKESLSLYRKHIVQYPKEKLKYWLEEKIQSLFRKNKKTN